MANHASMTFGEWTLAAIALGVVAGLVAGIFFAGGLYDIENESLLRPSWGRSGTPLAFVITPGAGLEAWDILSGSTANIWPIYVISVALAFVIGAVLILMLWWLITVRRNTN